MKLLDGEGEVGVGEGLVLQGEVPPLGIERLEAVTEHRLTQNHAVLELLGGDAAFGAGWRFAVVAGIFAGLGIAAEVGVALGPEPVEGAAHVELLLSPHVEQGQVEGRAARMTALQTDVLLGEEHALVEVGVEVGLHQRVVDVLSPAHKVVDALLRTVGIVDFQAIALLDNIVADGLQTVSSLTGEQSGGFLVAVDAASHKIVGAKVADFQNHVGHDVGKCHKLAGIVGRNDGGVLFGAGGQHAGAAEDEDGGHHPFAFVRFHNHVFNFRKFRLRKLNHVLFLFAKVVKIK